MTIHLQTNPAAGLIHDELEARGVTASEAARCMHIPRSRLSDIFRGRKGVSADTALRIERYLGISASLLLRLQADFDLGKAREEKGEELKRTIRPAAA